MKTVKKFSSVLMALMMVLTAMPMTALSAVALTSGDFEYDVLSEEDKTCEITGYTGSATELAIPPELNGYTVTSIGSSAFYSCSSLTSITIPDGVTSIGEGAFVYCDSLTSVTISNSVTSIVMGAFFGCTSLISIDVAVGNPNYTSKNGALFSKEKTGLICYPADKPETSYVIPNSVTSIGDYAFSNCTSLKNITIPDSVTSIGDYAFAGCTLLKSITIPDSVTSIGIGAFYFCTSLTSATIGNGVTSIGEEAFAYCTLLKSIIIPDSVTSIGDNAFFDSGLKTIYGYTGSYAETFASEKGYTFVVLNTRGDINGDGAPSSADYAMIRAYATGNAVFDDVQKITADLNCDGAVDAYDAIHLDLYLNGYLDTL